MNNEYLYPAEQEAKAQMQGAVAQQKDWSSGSTSASLDDYAKSLGGKVTSGLPGTSELSGQAWGGMYPPPVEPKHACPNCSYCPHCGRGGCVPNYPLPYQPWTYYPQPYWGDKPFTITCGTNNIH